jgi:hypothetical protein
MMFDNSVPSFQVQDDRTPRSYKNFTCLRDNPDYLFWRVAEPPQELAGYFTTITVLEKAIDEYLERHSTKEKEEEIPAIYRTTDGLVLVRLRHSEERAVIDAVDFDSLMAKGVSSDWIRSPSSYMKVATRLNGEANLTPLARIIVQAPEGTAVKYIDGNFLNLRRSNLLLSTMGERLSKLKDDTK